MLEIPGVVMASSSYTSGFSDAFAGFCAEAGTEGDVTFPCNAFQFDDTGAIPPLLL